MAEYIVQTSAPLGGHFKPGDYEEVYGKVMQEVVCCRDCKHALVTRKGKTLCVIARHVYYDLFREVNPDGFCAWGERKEGE